MSISYRDTDDEEEMRMQIQIQSNPIDVSLTVDETNLQRIIRVSAFGDKRVATTINRATCVHARILHFLGHSRPRRHAQQQAQRREEHDSVEHRSSPGSPAGDKRSLSAIWIERVHLESRTPRGDAGKGSSATFLRSIEKP